MSIDIQERYKLVFRQLNYAVDFRIKILQGLSWLYVTLGGAFVFMWEKSRPNSYIVPAVGAVVSLFMWLADIRNRDGIGDCRDVGREIENDPLSAIPPKQKFFTRSLPQTPLRRLIKFPIHSFLIDIAVWIIILSLGWLTYYLWHSQGVPSLIGIQPTCNSMQMMTILGLILTLIATIFLFLGSQHKSWVMQTWSGESDAEKAFTIKKQAQTNIGFLLLFLGFLSQLIGIIMQKG